MPEVWSENGFGLKQKSLALPSVVWPWLDDLTSPSLSFSIYKMEETVLLRLVMQIRRQCL